AAVLFGLISAANAAGVQSKSALPPSSPPPTVFVAPTPTPQAPPTNPGPAVAAPGGLSPLLAQPGPPPPIPPRAGPTYPASPVPAPIEQPNMPSYPHHLVIQPFHLARQRVSPRTP